VLLQLSLNSYSPVVNNDFIKSTNCWTDMSVAPSILTPLILKVGVPETLKAPIATFDHCLVFASLALPCCNYLRTSSVFNPNKELTF
jgi:hypothetical protein